MPILSTFGAGSFAGVHPPASGGGGAPASVIGRYFYSTTDFLWSTLTNWFGNLGHSTSADEYPNDTTSVVILSNCTIDLDDVSFVEPASIEITGNDIDTAPADGFDDGYILTLYSIDEGYLPETVDITGDGWLDLNGGSYGAPI